MQAVFGNFTRNPECFFEARSIPGSRRLIFTASGHHSITAGSLVLLDPRYGPDTPAALTRLTPEVPFPEAEGRPATYYANPYPLSEDHYLVAWSDRPLRFQGEVNDTAALGVYLYDAFGNLNLLYRDPAMGSQYPLPVRPRPRPPMVGQQAASVDASEAQLLLSNVYAGLGGVAPGTIKRLRVVGMPVKTHPTMDSPSIGVTTHDNGRFVLGTVPVEAGRLGLVPRAGRRDVLPAGLGRVGHGRADDAQRHLPAARPDADVHRLPRAPHHGAGEPGGPGRAA